MDVVAVLGPGLWSGSWLPARVDRNAAGTVTREREIRAEGVKLLRALGCRVEVFSENRATRNTPGVPDVYAFLPNGRGTVWWEAKVPGGRISYDQYDFEAACLMCGQPYVRGGLAELRHFLAGLEIVDYSLRAVRSRRFPSGILDAT